MADKAGNALTLINSGVVTSDTLIINRGDDGAAPDVTGNPRRVALSTIAALLFATPVFTGLTTMTVGAANTGVLASTGYSLTGSDATGMVSLAGTWNTSGTPTAILLSLTDTASNVSSRLMHLRTNGNNGAQFIVNKLGIFFGNSNGGVNRFPKLGQVSAGGFIYELGTSDGSASPIFQWAINTQEIAFGGMISIGTTYSAADIFISRRAAASINLGAADTASPVAQTLGVQSVVAGTTDTAGVNWTLRGSVGTGTGAGGDIIFQTAPAGTTGTAQNAFATALTIKGSGKVITAASIAARAGFNITDGTAPTSPVLGDLWAESGVLKYFDGSTTKSLAFV